MRVITCNPKITIGADELPLSVILRVMRGDTSITDRQLRAAEIAAPYLHAMLPSTPAAPAAPKSVRVQPLRY
jgi:hypothetical protein